MNIVIPEGKISDYIDGKPRNDTPEEYVRQTIERRLINELKYKDTQIQIEYTLRNGTTRPRADIVIWNHNTQEHTQATIKIIIECKKDSILPENSKEGIKQLKSYMSVCPNCEWGMWTNSISRFVFRKIITPEGEIDFEECNDIPPANGRVDEIDFAMPQMTICSSFSGRAIIIFMFMMDSRKIWHSLSSLRSYSAR